MRIKTGDFKTTSHPQEKYTKGTNLKQIQSGSTQQKHGQ